jgi:hypothetical protein
MLPISLIRRSAKFIKKIFINRVVKHLNTKKKIYQFFNKDLEKNTAHKIYKIHRYCYFLDGKSF